MIDLCEGPEEELNYPITHTGVVLKAIDISPDKLWIYYGSDYIFNSFTMWIFAKICPRPSLCMKMCRSGGLKKIKGENCGHNAFTLIWLVLLYRCCLPEPSPPAHGLPSSPRPTAPAAHSCPAGTLPAAQGRQLLASQPLPQLQHGNLSHTCSEQKRLQP